MRRERFGLRTITCLLLAGPVVVGLPPGTATAASEAVRGPDPVLGKGVTAGGSHAGYPAAHVTDGSRLSYWEGPAGAFPQWIRVDLGGAVEAGQIVLELPTGWEARTQTLSVEGSTDGSSFAALSGSAAHRFDPDGGNPEEPPADGTDLALGKPIETSSAIHSFVATNANDGQLGTYWESTGHPATLTAGLGADADPSGIVVKLNPDAAWAKRTQSIEVLGREQASGSFTSVKARADCTFDPGAGDNTVTVPVTGRYADVRPRFTHNTGGYGARVAELQVVGTAAPPPRPGRLRPLVDAHGAHRDGRRHRPRDRAQHRDGRVLHDTMNYPGVMPATDHDPLPFSGRTLIADNGLYRTGGAFRNEDQEFGAITLFAQGTDIPGAVIRDTGIHESTYDGIQFKPGGGAVPDARITGVAIDRSDNGSGILAMGGARGSTTLTDVTITGSAQGDVLIEPGSQFVINR